MAVDVRIGQGHRITIPKALRDEIGLEAGDTVSLESVDGGILVKRIVDDDEAWLESEWVEAAIREGEADIAAGRVSGPFETGEQVREYFRGVRAAHAERSRSAKAEAA